MALYTNIKGPVNYTIVGNPTIENGIANGFSTSDYLKIPSFTPENKSWELKLKFLSNNAGTTQAIVRLNTGTGDYGGMLIGMNANNRLWWNIGSSGTSWFQTNPTIDPVLTNNTWYEILVKYDGSKYTLSIINNGIATVVYTNNTTTPIYQQGDTTIGARVTGTTNYFRGSVDLNNTYIKIGNISWFGTSFSKVKVRRGLVNYNYTIVGSPTINNNIVSGFSNSNYIKLKTAPSNVTSYEIQLKFKTTAFNNRRVIGDSTTNCHSIQLEVPASNEITMWYGHPSSSHGWNGVQGTIPITANVWYWFKAIWNGTKVSTYISTDGYNWMTDNTVNTSTCGWDQATAFGYDQGNALTGFIDLNECYMIVNGEYIFRGSKQSSDSYKIQTDNILNGYYIIEDGKLLWANPSIYLQFSGEQYINTSFNANQDTRIKMKALTTTIASNQGFFVGRNAAMVNTFAAWILKDGNNVIFRDDYNTSQNKTSYNVTTNTIYNIDFNKNEFYVNDTLYSTTNYALFQSTYPIIIGASTRYTATDTNYGNFFKGKIYKCQIYDNNILVRHFVPVPTGLQIGNFTVPSNGMFDIVNQQFYPNQGSGTFTYGKD